MKKLFLMLMLCAPMTLFAQKFGKVNTAVIMQSLPDVAKADGELKALQKQKENEMKGMQDELTRKSQEYEKNKSTMNPTKQKETESELQALYQKIQQAYQDAQQEIEKKSAELQNPIIMKVRNAINAVGKAGGYTYIFEEGAAVYTGETVKDVTAEVQAKLNAAK
ncbi:MAG: OmpH family outer membrane protein [Prevotellaceae bacterium]|nr:OmpH family outer membrane protein [Prevotellaceae bacterium]